MFHYRDGCTPDRDTLAAMVAAVAHRGPDESGVHVSGPLGIGHSRLSILDLSHGRQPLFSEDRGAAVIGNGEIYNAVELREELESRGHRFSSRSDTEVIVHLYEEKGADCVADLRGMFAFAVADFHNRRLLLARDRMGKKPLFLADDGRRLAFCSELKSLLAGGLISGEIDPQAVELYLTYGYVPSPWSIFKGVVKLPPGYLAVCGPDGMRQERYWDLEFDPTPDLVERDAAEELEAILEEAVRVRLMSDVPLGAFLSGGIDSGTIVALMSRSSDVPVKTHTVGFDDPTLDERDDAASVSAALGSDHVATEVRTDLIDVLPRVAWHLDEPFADPSAVPTWYVSRETRRRVTVALSGDGGDELFAGYPWRYRMHLWEEKIRPFVPTPVRQGLFPFLSRHWPQSLAIPRVLRGKSLLENLSVDADRAYFLDRSVIGAELRDRLRGDGLRDLVRGFDPFVALEPHIARAPQDDVLSRALYLDIKTWLTDDILVKVDRMSMAHSLEVRCPLLDQEVVEFAGRVPSSLKLGRGMTKILLRGLAKRLLPREILERPKRGFVPPISRWLRSELKEFTREMLLGSEARTRDLLNAKEVGRFLDDHESGRIDAGWPIWALLMLEMWGRTVADGGRQKALSLEVGDVVGT